MPGSVAVSIRTGRTAAARQARSKLAGMGKKAAAEMERLKAQHAKAWAEYTALRDQARHFKGDRKSPELKEIVERRNVKSREYSGLNDKMVEARKRAAAEQREAVLYVDNPSTCTAVEKSRFKGERKEAIQEGVEEFRKMVGTGTLDGETVNLKAGGRSRSKYHKETCYLTVWARQATTIHEMGHWLEDLDGDAHVKAVRFLNDRTKGEELQPLRELKPGYEYRDDEWAHPDKFTDPYMGKYYDYNEATEIISMGMEEMWSDPAGFAVADPEYFDFMYNLLRGQ